MKASAFRNMCHAPVKEHNIHQNILRGCVNKFQEDEHNAMKQNYMKISVASSSVVVVKCRYFKTKFLSFFMDSI